MLETVLEAPEENLSEEVDDESTSSDDKFSL